MLVWSAQLILWQQQQTGLKGPKELEVRYGLVGHATTGSTTESETEALVGDELSEVVGSWELRTSWGKKEEKRRNHPTQMQDTDILQC